MAAIYTTNTLIFTKCQSNKAGYCNLQIALKQPFCYIAVKTQKMLYRKLSIETK